MFTATDRRYLWGNGGVLGKIKEVERPGKGVGDIRRVTVQGDRSGERGQSICRARFWSFSANYLGSVSITGFEYQSETPAKHPGPRGLY